MGAVTIYFSKTGTTENVAKKISLIAGGDLFQIKLQKKYPSSFFATVIACAIEKIKNEKPALACDIPDMSGYDKIIVGFPIWAGSCPKGVEAFLEKCNTDGKDIYLFCTSGSTKIDGAVRIVSAICKNANIKDGIRINSDTGDDEIEKWLHDR